MSWLFSTFLLVSILPLSICTSNDESWTNENYGLDVSFPIQSHASRNYDFLPHNLDPSLRVPPELADQPIQPLGDRHHIYLDHLEACRKHYAPDNSGWCDEFEYHRILMNRRQPRSMVNLTETGFKKVRVPDHLKRLVQDFWKNNRQGGWTDEKWAVGNSYYNHWDGPTKMVSVDDVGLRGSGVRLKKEIWSALSAIMEEWTQQELQPSSLYGIRIYPEGSIMLPHVDRLPLVASAIINVAQDVEEDWPTEIYDHEGQAHNITLEPGEMLLFESGSCIHGHPFPLNGKYYASIFVHFEPTGKALEMSQDGIYHLKGSRHSNDKSRKEKEVDKEYRENTKKGHGGQTSSFDGRLPPYIQRASPEEEHWLQEHPAGWAPPVEILPPESHVAAKRGILKELELEIEQRGNQVLTERDENGWQVLHQGVAGGNEEVVEFLISKGADINARTHGGYGETPLRIAEKRYGQNNSIVAYLKRLGALSIGPEL